MITLPGEKMASRVAASVIAATGLGDDLIVHSLQGK
jgi:predicted O-linked N-acetylglucosamine transferase (SPINDLY family)